jgi:hypothetical protein
MIGEDIIDILESIILELRKVAKLPHKASPTATFPPGPTESGSIDPDSCLSPCTITTVDAQFSPAQRQEINEAMNVIFSLFGGADKFYAATGIPNLRFVCTTQLSCTQSNAVSCYVGNGVIEMTAGAFSPAPLVSGWYIAHEVGHAFDFSRSGGKPGLYRSQAFVEHFVPKNWLQRLFRLPIIKVARNIGYEGKVWTEIAKTTGASIRGELNSAEDFADTFAVIYAEAITQGVLPYRSFNSRWRHDEVYAMIKDNS